MSTKPEKRGASPVTLQDVLVGVKTSFREVVRRIGEQRSGVVLVVEPDGRLAGIVTAGDVLRAVLGGVELGASVEQVMTRGPVTGSPGLTSPEMMRLMLLKGISHLPVVDGSGRPTRLVYASELEWETLLDAPVILYGGGVGADGTPAALKPMQGRPLLEVHVERLRSAGVGRFTLCLDRSAEQVRALLGDGSRLRLGIDYVVADRPLGSAGVLSILPSRPEEPFLLLNAEILTDADYRAFLAFHRDREAVLTVGVRRFQLAVPFGVVDVQHERIVGLSEKPVYEGYANSGVYVADPSILDHMRRGETLEMTDLIRRLLAARLTVCHYPISESWS